MKNTLLTNHHKAVIKVLRKEDLTSFQILNKLNNISLILVVYSLIDELRNMGILKSYVKEDMKYYHLQ